MTSRFYSTKKPLPPKGGLATNKKLPSDKFFLLQIELPNRKIKQCRKANP